MQYISTRGSAPSLNFTEALLTGLASDGGLYVPAVWPAFDKSELRALANASYAEIAAAVLARFVGDTISEADLQKDITDAYARFRHQAVVPLVQMDDSDWMLELFHGPTLAFKDVAMRFIAQLYEHALGERGERMTIICATSGDTGGAAAAAFAGFAAGK